MDEVQKAPALFPAIKLAVDRDRTPGRFLLLGSANFLLMRRITETLAGRIILRELDGLSWGERHRLPPSVMWHQLLVAADLDAVALPSQPPALAEPLTEAVAAGGLPPAALERDPARRERWLQGLHPDLPGARPA